jgi:hypothetical protein
MDHQKLRKVQEILGLFDEKADLLAQRRFSQRLRDEGAGVRLRSGTGERHVTYFGPDDEDLAAFLLTLRLFLQDNERTSLRNMARLYSALPISEALRQEASDRRSALNTKLAEAPHVRIVGEGIDTLCAVLDVFMYGHHAHANSAKRMIHRRLTNDEEIYALARHGFLQAVTEVRNAVFWFRDFHTRVRQELTRA